MVKISFLIANYNKEKYIEKSLLSLIDLPKSLDLEFIFVDDGSTDSSVIIFDRLTHGDSRFKKILVKKNSGKIKAFSLAFLEAGGDYVKLFGSDDILNKEEFSRFYRFIRGDEIYVHNFSVAVDIKNVIKEKFWPDRKFKQIVNLREAISGFSYPSGALLIRRDIASRIFPIPAEVPYEDWYFSVLFSLMGLRFSIYNEAVFYYIQSENSVWGGVYNQDREIINMRSARDLKMIYWLTNSGLLSSDNKYIINKIKALKFTCSPSFCNFIRLNFFSRTCYRAIAKVVYSFLTQLVRK